MKFAAVALALGLALAFALGRFDGAAAQTPPASPDGLTLVRAWADDARLEWQDNADGETGFVVTVEARSPDGAEVDAARLGATPAGQTYIVLPRALAVPAGRCYDATFAVYAAAPPDEIMGEPGVLKTQMCVGNDGRRSFPALVADTAPPPAVATGVRVLPDGRGGYRVTWRDNSDDETRFDIGIGVMRQDGAGVGGYALGFVSANVESFDVPLRLLEIPVGECYDATVYVFAARGETASGLPGNLTLPLCVEDTRIVFPSAGDGPVLGGVDHRLTALSLAMALLGAACVVLAHFRPPISGVEPPIARRPPPSRSSRRIRKT